LLRISTWRVASGKPSGLISHRAGFYASIAPWRYSRHWPLDRSAAVLLPLHLVVTGQDGLTQVHFLNPAAALYSGLPVTARAAVSKLQARVAQAVESVSTRQNPLELIA
jgi:hypothetical protein